MESLDKSFFSSAFVVEVVVEEVVVVVEGSTCGGAVPEPACQMQRAGTKRTVSNFFCVLSDNNTITGENLFPDFCL